MAMRAELGGDSNKFGWRFSVPEEPLPELVSEEEERDSGEDTSSVCTGFGVRDCPVCARAGVVKEALGGGWRDGRRAGASI